MNTKFSIATLLAAVALAAGGIAVAQPSSTAGHGCTATANAFRGGNMSAQPATGAVTCTSQGATAAVVAPAPATAIVETAPAPLAAAPVVTTQMGATGPVESPAPVRVARADRN